YFPEHRAWNQPVQTGDVIQAHGVNPLLSGKDKKARVKFTLSAALDARLKVDGEDRIVALRAKDELSLAPDDLVWPPPAAFRSTEAFQEWYAHQGTYGGAFAALLGNYLKDESYPEKAKYTVPGPAVPPVLIWQGERTQPDWLFQFLLDPIKVRELTVLRMPKFNMSPEEAKALVDYFAAVEKRFNPDVDLTAPYPKIPQRAPLASDYWRKKTEEYVPLMKNDKGSQYQQEVEAYKAVWGKMMEDWKTEAKTAAERAK